MPLFLNWFKLPFAAVRPPRLDARDYHAFRCAQELAMARKARSAAAADAHARLAMAHRQAADGSPSRTAPLPHFEGAGAG